MNITSVNSFNQNFKATIKMTRANKEVLKGAATVAAGASALAYGAESMATVLAPENLNSMVKSLPEDVVDSHFIVLTSAAEAGIPAQSTAAPSALSICGTLSMEQGTSKISNNKKYLS